MVVLLLKKENCQQPDTLCQKEFSGPSTLSQTSPGFNMSVVQVL